MPAVLLYRGERVANLVLVPGKPMRRAFKRFAKMGIEVTMMRVVGEDAARNTGFYYNVRKKCWRPVRVLTDKDVRRLRRKGKL